MLIYRTAINYKLENKKLKVKSNRSYCDFCGRQLRWFENIPVLSWVIQAGKSRCCNNPLPREYPIIEITMGVLFLLNFNNQISITPNNFQLSITNIQVALSLVMVTMLVFSAVFDAKYMILPDFSTGILVGMAVVMIALERGQGSALSVQDRLLAGAMGPAFLGILHVVTKGKGMGLGDVKLAVFMGLFLGLSKLVVAFYVAFLIGAVVGLILMTVGKKKRRSLIAFGPFLILATFISWWFGDMLINQAIGFL